MGGLPIAIAITIPDRAACFPPTDPWLPPSTTCPPQPTPPRTRATIRSGGALEPRLCFRTATPTIGRLTLSTSTDTSPGEVLNAGVPVALRSQPGGRHAVGVRPQAGRGPHRLPALLAAGPADAPHVARAVAARRHRRDADEAADRQRLSLRHPRPRFGDGRQPAGDQRRRGAGGDRRRRHRRRLCRPGLDRQLDRRLPDLLGQAVPGR